MSSSVKRAASSVRRRLSDERGLTLVELLVVLAILGLVVGVVGPRVMDLFGKAKSDTARIEIERLSGILDIYQLDTGSYPSGDQGLMALVERPATATHWTGPYVKGEKSLLDPWGRLYLYRYPGERGTYDLYSLGADGAEGGEGQDADIGNWQE